MAQAPPRIDEPHVRHDKSDECSRLLDRIDHLQRPSERLDDVPGEHGAPLPARGLAALRPSTHQGDHRMIPHDVATTLAKLPPVCFAATEDGRAVRITRGEPGYQPVSADLSPDALNAALEPPPTAEQIEAMIIGSMFGWDRPGADPDVVRAHGDRRGSPA